MSKITVTEEAGTPATPSTGKWIVYTKSDGLYVIDDAGNETKLGAGGGISGITLWDEGVPQGTGTVINFVGANVDVSVSGTVARVFVTGSAGSSLPSFITGSIPFSNAAGTLIENNPYLRWENTLRGLRIGVNASKFNFADIFPIGAVANNPNEAVTFGILTYGTGSLGTPAPNFGGYRSRGTYIVPTPVQKDDALFSAIGNGYDGSDYLNVARMRFYADGNFVTGAYTSTRIEFEVVPSGSATRRTQLSVHGDSVNIPTGSTYNIGGVPHTHASSGGDGWNAGIGTWSYVSADSPSFVCNVPDADAALFSVGARFSLTQTTEKFFIVTAKGSPSGGYTPCTIYGGTDYTLANAAITSPKWSNVKAPLGFPLDPAKWTVTTTSTSDCTKASPTANTYYGGTGLSPTGPSISIPIGKWDVRMHAQVQTVITLGAVGNVSIRAGLSTADNAIPSDLNWLSLFLMSMPAGTVTLRTTITNNGHISAAAKTTYYVVMTSGNSATSIDLLGASLTTSITATCVYL